MYDKGVHLNNSWIFSQAGEGGGMKIVPDLEQFLPHRQTDRQTDTVMGKRRSRSTSNLKRMRMKKLVLGFLSPEMHAEMRTVKVFISGQSITWEARKCTSQTHY